MKKYYHRFHVKRRALAYLGYHGWHGVYLALRSMALDWWDER